ncbi:hypothetical protein GCK32_009124 [Trichostrongylus colubriformis]|uniref:Uncharacterized protein n=1 Tax=Trichostrongylus colubriformis TaxID=6319 RepID=A0AAN8G446_TRICO
MRKTVMCNRVPLERYHGVIYMRTTTVEDQNVFFNRNKGTMKEWQQMLQNVEQLRKRNEEVWSHHRNFVPVEVLPNDKFRKRLQLACGVLAKLLDFKLDPRWEALINEKFPS